MDWSYAHLWMGKSTCRKKHQQSEHARLVFNMLTQIISVSINLPLYYLNGSGSTVPVYWIVGIIYRTPSLIESNMLFRSTLLLPFWYCVGYHAGGRSLREESKCSNTITLQCVKIAQLYKIYKLGQVVYELRHEKTCLMPYANNKGADQPAHPRSLISAFVFAA